MASPLSWEIETKVNRNDDDFCLILFWKQKISACKNEWFLSVANQCTACVFCCTLRLTQWFGVFLAFIVSERKYYKSVGVNAAFFRINVASVLVGLLTFVQCTYFSWALFMNNDYAIKVNWMKCIVARRSFLGNEKNVYNTHTARNWEITNRRPKVKKKHILRSKAFQCEGETKKEGQRARQKTERKHQKMATY